MLEIWHNPRCRKSREGLKVLEDAGIEFTTRIYLTDSPSAAELTEALQKMGLSARDIIRKGEQEYKDLNLKDQNLSEKDLIAAMADHPKLIERPIVVSESTAVLGRPAENISAMLAEL
jgi:arsenate reductase